jgi:hypothetical protein
MHAACVQVMEVQKFTCKATGGMFRIRFRNYESPLIVYSAKVSEFKAALEAMDSCVLRH